MHPLDPRIRNAVRAVIIEHDRILLLRKEGGRRGSRFALPGGAQDPGETLIAALQRECVEEIGTEVEILELAHVGDWFKQRDTEPPSTRHLVEFLFRCRVPTDYTPHIGHHPDKHQVAVQWLALQELPRQQLLPHAMIHHLRQMSATSAPTYLGTLT